LFKKDALKRESYFKTNMGKRSVKLMLKSTLDELGCKNISLNTLKILLDAEENEA